MSLTRRGMLGSGAATLAAPAFGQNEGRKPPNVVFLISDDHSAPDLGCYGNSAVTTPNLDRMAREGMRFERCFVTSPQCSPNRSSIFTGCTPHTTATSRLHTPLPDWEPTFIDALKGRDYFTGIYRKHHQGPGFQKRLDFYGTAKQPFSEFFDKLPKNKPFWLQLGFTDPHRPYSDGAFSPPHDPAKVQVPKFLPDWPEVRKDLAHYYDYIARMDRECGQLFELLKQRGLDRDTLVVFTGDNGMPFPRAKGTLYEAGIHVPLLAWWPGRIAPGTVKREMIGHVDLAPTWLEAAGLPKPPKMQGRSFLPLLQGGRYQPRTEVFAERNWHDTFDPLRCIRTEHHKLVFTAAPHFPYRPPSDLEGSPTWQAMWSRRRGETPVALRHLFNPSRPVLQLFDIQQDPLEWNNLIDSDAHRDVRIDLERRLSRWMADTYDFLPPGLGTGSDPLQRSWPFTL